MEITLQTNRKEQSFSKKETEKSTKRVTEKEPEKFTKDKLFIVYPWLIKWSLFEQEREDPKQEATRKIILAALERTKKYPNRYSRSFKTIIPEKTWESKTVSELSWMAVEKGGHMADWVEQALVWAQKIQNGKTWEDICNKPDTIKCYRLVTWKDGSIRGVGGLCNNKSEASATEISLCGYGYKVRLKNAVPLIVLYF